MSKFKINSINRFTSGTSEKIMSITYGIEGSSDLSTTVYIAPVEQNSDKFSTAYQSNMYSICDSDSTDDANDAAIIHPLFDIADVCIKNPQKKVGEYVHHFDSASDKFVDIFSPSFSQALNFVQYNDAAFILTPKTSDAQVQLNTDLYDQRKTTPPVNIFDNSYQYSLFSKTLNTFIYSDLSTLLKDTIYDGMKLDYSDLSGMQLSTVFQNAGIQISSVFLPSLNLNGVQHNYLLEIKQNMNDPAYKSDFKDGNVFGDFIILKNDFNSTYSMELSANGLYNTRDYIDVGTCGDIIYLKYYDNINNNATLSSRSKKIDVSSVADMIPVNSVQHNFPHQKVEVLHSMNRFVNTTKHKSNLYSIELHNSNLTNGVEDTSSIKLLKSKIRQDIQNNVREIANSICPANTQLFNIQYSS